MSEIDINFERGVRAERDRLIKLLFSLRAIRKSLIDDNYLVVYTELGAIDVHKKTLKEWKEENE